MGVEVKELIVSTLSVRGKGTKHSPIRTILEVYTKEGELIADHDPSPETFTRTDLINYMEFMTNSKPTNKTIDEWLESIES